MFPLGDDNSMRRSTPYVTYILIIINVLVFLLELQNGDEFIQEWAFVPGRFSADPTTNIATIFTAMFMHGGWLHLGGNMLYLWIFGDNVEDRFGHFKFLLFYLAHRHRRDLCPVLRHARLERAERRRFGRHRGHPRRLYPDVPAGTRERAGRQPDGRHAGPYRPRDSG